MDKKLVIKELSAKRGLTLKELAERVGVTANMLSMASNGNTGLSMKILFAIADELNVSVGELFSDYKGYQSRCFCPKCGAMLEVRLVEDGHSEAEQQ